ncbi:GIY-YIG nuclease family protein [Gymnodinialimonas sp.]
MTGRSLELYFVDGKPDGMLTAEVFNWTGHVLKIPRTRIVEGLKRPEAAYTGVYILVGDEDGAPKIYVGEAETLSERLRQHLKNKDWWDDVIVVTTAGDALHKAHVKYLESCLVETALSVGKARVENGNTPTRSSLNEAAAANIESFLATLMMVLPAIRVDAFDEKRRTMDVMARSTTKEVPTTFVMEVARHGVKARSILRDGEMIVLSQSIVRSEWIGDRSNNTHYFKLHDELRANGTIVEHDGQGILTQDFAFSSPSAAAAVVAGRAANGRTSWLVEGTRQTYADWELAQTKDPNP